MQQKVYYILINDSFLRHTLSFLLMDCWVLFDHFTHSAQKPCYTNRKALNSFSCRCRDMKLEHLCFINVCGLAMHFYWADATLIGGKLEKHAESAIQFLQAPLPKQDQLKRNWIETTSLWTSPHLVTGLKPSRCKWRPLIFKELMWQIKRRHRKCTEHIQLLPAAAK